MSSIDVAIPNYNYGHYLERSVRSVLAQDIPDLRIRIIDNASTDDSVEIAKQLAAEDPRISINIHEKNLGALASINEGIEWAEADYFLMLTADDILTPGALKRAQTVLDENEDAVFAFGKYLTFHDGDPIDEFVNKQPAPEWHLLEGGDYIKRCCEGIVQVVSPLVRTSVHKRVHYRKEAYYLSDLEAFMRLASFGQVAETNTIQALQGLHDSNISTAIWKDPMCNFNGSKDMLESFFNTEGHDMPNASTLRRLGLRNLGKRAYWSAASHFMRGHFKISYDLFKFSIRLRPTSLLLPPIDYLKKYDDFEYRAKNALSFLRLPKRTFNE
jgi:glycosyltransferase involved in cell wall biosynthesis